jgi:hypothetical protein
VTVNGYPIQKYPKKPVHVRGKLESRYSRFLASAVSTKTFVASSSLLAQGSGGHQTSAHTRSATHAVVLREE